MKKLLLYNTLRKTALVLLFIVSMNALAAGFSFMVTPTGADIGISTDYLKPSAPFSNFFIPGIVLFVVIGVFSCLVGIGTLLKVTHYPLLVMMQGSLLMGWIAVPLTMVTAYHTLHLIIAIIGAVLLVIGWMLHKQKENMQAAF